MKKSPKKWICVNSLKLYRVYLDPLNMSNAGDVSWSWIFKGLINWGSKRGRKICRRMSTSSIKRQIGRFYVVVVQWTSKKCTKRRDARAELLFWPLNLLFFWTCRCGRRRSCLSSLFRPSVWPRLMRLNTWCKGKIETLIERVQDLKPIMCLINVMAPVKEDTDE